LRSFGLLHGCCAAAFGFDAAAFCRWITGKPELFSMIAGAEDKARTGG